MSLIKVINKDEAVLDRAKVGLNKVPNALPGTQIQIQDVSNSLTAHINNHSNPHQVTRLQLGFNNGGNDITGEMSDNPALNNSLVIASTKATASLLAAIASLTSSVNNHISNTSNPHNTTKDQVGLSNIPNQTSYSNGTGDNVNNNSSQVLATTALTYKLLQMIQGIVIPTPPNQVNNDPYGTTWNGATTIAPSKNAVYQKIRSMEDGKIKAARVWLGPNQWARDWVWTHNHQIPTDQVILSCSINFYCNSAEGGYAVGMRTQAQSSGIQDAFNKGSSDYDYGVAAAWTIGSPTFASMFGDEVFLRSNAAASNGSRSDIFSPSTDRWSVEFIFYYALAI